MASNRYISTNFWKDNYIIDLDPTEKLLFIYFLTNPKTNIAGAYEINLREVAFDTGIDKDMIIKVIARFQKDGKMFYQNGWMVLKNWIKHQQINPSVRKGIDRCLKLLPEYFQEYILTDEDNYSVGIAYDSLYTGSDILNLNLTKLNLNLNPNVATASDGIISENKKASTKEIDGMFDYWQSEVGYSITSKKKQNREYAGKLLHEYSKQDIALMIKAAAMASEDQYAPGVSDFIDLYRKWDKLKLWGKKKINKPKGRGFTAVKR